MLPHTRVYVFADHHDIAPLRQLALSKLRRAMKTSIDQHSFKDNEEILSIIRYIYDNTLDTQHERSSPLRNLATCFAGQFMEDFDESDEFYQTFGEVKRLARDLLWLNNMRFEELKRESKRLSAVNNEMQFQEAKRQRIEQSA